jgi:hypothetical protein
MALDRRLIGVLRRPAAGAALLALVATGCWPQPAAGPGNARNNGLETQLTSTNVAALEELWSVPTAAWAYEPVIDGGRVVVSEDWRPNSGALHVEAFSPVTGARLWDRVLVEGGAQPVVSPAAFSRDGLVTGYGIRGNSFPPPSTCPTGIERLDPATGATLAVATGRVPVGPAMTSGDSVAVVTQGIGADCVRGGQARFEVRDRETLELVYAYVPPDGSVSDSIPTFAGDLVYVIDGQRLVALPAAGCGAATCSPVWTVTAPNNNPPLFENSFTSVVAADGVLFATTRFVVATTPPTISSDVRVFDPVTGAPLGFTNLGGGTGVLAVRDSTLYYTQDPSGPGAVHVRAVGYCRDCTTTQFTDLWSAPIDASHFTTGVTIGGDVVYVGASVAGDGVVLAFDADGCGSATCSPLVTADVTGSATDLSVSGGRVFAATTLGTGDDFGLSALGLP